MAKRLRETDYQFGLTLRSMAFARKNMGHRGEVPTIQQATEKAAHIRRSEHVRLDGRIGKDKHNEHK